MKVSGDGRQSRGSAWLRGSAGLFGSAWLRGSPGPQGSVGPRWLLLTLLLGLAQPGSAGPAPVVLVLGDSLSAAYGMDTRQGWVALLQARLAREGWPHRVVNASISGDTTRGGRARLGAALERHRPALVLIELGGNDGLRGIAVEETGRNLESMVREARAAGARVLLVGIRLPPNYGPVYGERFRRVFEELAEREGVPLVPFLLEGVGGDPELMLEDGIHPRAEAQPRLLENVWPRLVPVLERSGMPVAPLSAQPATAP
ncbi:MAG: arylesterase [Gammaproteobacteria bacterium]|nr:arylesterase [Gammaproteobacteria bacterium]